MIGSTLGTVLCCSRKAKDGKDVLLNRYKAHHGPIRSLQRNPLFPKNFLTAGDWSMKIWSEDITTSPLQWVWSGNKLSQNTKNSIDNMPSKQGEHKVTSAMWSPVRPSVLLASRQDGYLMVKSRMYHIQYYSLYF